MGSTIALPKLCSGKLKTGRYLSHNGTGWFYNAVMYPKDANEMGNSIEPDQTADLGLRCFLRPICRNT